MVTKKKPTTSKAAPRRAAPASKAAPRRRTRKSGVTMIPSAMATAALVAVNYNGIKNACNYVLSSSSKGITGGIRNLATGSGSGARAARAGLIGKEALVRDAVAIAGGYVGGELVKSYAPGFIKRPLAKISKKIPKVI